MKYQSRVDTVIDEAADTANRLASKAANVGKTWYIRFNTFSVNLLILKISNHCFSLCLIVANKFASDAFNKDN